MTNQNLIHSNHQQLANMLEAYEVPAILVSTDYQILSTNRRYQDKFGEIDFDAKPRCYAVSHGYNRPCDEAGEDCPLMAAKQSGHKEKVLHIHQTPNGREHVDVEMIPIFDESQQLAFFVELLKPVPLASGAADDKEVVGRSGVFTQTLQRVTKVAASQASVLLLGESGTGKELIARLVHMASDRADQPMVTLECSGLSETLIESELFGHKKGAFTGALNDRKGLVEMADGGTLFLDEIGDVSLSTQVKLLRLLETKTFRRVGETGVRTSDFRLISATHRDLRAMVEDGGFRLDLFYRINIFPIRVPSLAQRKDDIPDLVEHLLHQIDPELHVTRPAIQLILRQQFPGNIRELRNLLVRAVVLSDTNVVDVAQIHEALSLESVWAEGASLGSTPEVDLKNNERVYIEHLMQTHNHNKQAVADVLGISLRTLYRKLNG